MLLLHAVLGSLVSFLFFTALAFIGGLFLKNVLRVDLSGHQLPVFSFSAGTGGVILSALVMGLSFAGWLNPRALSAVVTILAGAGIAGVVQLVRRPEPVTGRALRITGWPLAITAALSLPFLILPPVARDALVYHLEMPRQHLFHGGMITFPLNAYSYFPAGIEMLYLPVLSIFPPFVVQFLHFGFLLLTVLAVGETCACLGQAQPSRLAASGAILAFCSIPTLWLNATSAYIDTAWMFFSFLILAGLYLHLRLRRTEILGPVFVLLGFYPAIKYPGAYFLAAIFVALLLFRLIRKQTPALSARHVLAGVAAFTAAAFPYFLRNWLERGNPVYPFFASVFQAAPSAYLLDLERGWRGFVNNYGGYFTQPLLKPVSFLAVAVNPVLGDPAWFDGVIGPFILLWLFALPLLRRKNDSQLLLVATVLIYLLFWGSALRQARFLLPILPVILLLVLETAGDWMEKAGWRRVVLTGGIGLTLIFQLAVLVPEAAGRPFADYVTGRIGEAEFLSRRLPVYPCQRYINENLPADAVVWCLMSGNENFYLRRSYLADYVVEDYSFHAWLADCEVPACLAERFRARRVTHLLVNVTKLSLPALYADFPQEERQARVDLARAFFRERARLLFAANDFAVFELK